MRVSVKLSLCVCAPLGAVRGRSGAGRGVRHAWRAEGGFERRNSMRQNSHLLSVGSCSTAPSRLPKLAAVDTFRLLHFHSLIVLSVGCDGSASGAGLGAGTGYQAGGWEKGNQSGDEPLVASTIWVLCVCCLQKRSRLIFGSISRLFR